MNRVRFREGTDPHPVISIVEPDQIRFTTYSANRIVPGAVLEPDT